MPKLKDCTNARDRIEREKALRRSHEFVSDSREQKILMQLVELANSLRKFEGLHARGYLQKDINRHIRSLKLNKAARIQNLASKDGIPDYVVTATMLPESFPDDKTPEQFDKEAIEAFITGLFNMARMSDGTKPIKIPVKRQNLVGSCNEREEETVKQSATLCNLNVPAFITKATLYMARFIMRRRRNDEGHPYTPGEAYLFMEHGEAMQDAFTPDEVKLAMEKVGISGSRVADDLMAELERLRDKRMNPEA